MCKYLSKCDELFCYCDSSTSYLASAGEAVYKAMLAGDPDAVW